MRHTCRLPLVLIADESERDKLPFDLLVQRTIFFTDDMRGVATCKAQAIEQLSAALGGAIDSPIDAAVNIRAFQQGDAVERTLAELVTSVDGLSREVGRHPDRNIHPGAVTDLQRSFVELEKLAQERDDQDLQALCERLHAPVYHIVRVTGVADSDSEGLPSARAREVRRQLLRRRDQAREAQGSVAEPSAAPKPPKGTAKGQARSQRSKQPPS
jgi:hypothetical protein